MTDSELRSRSWGQRRGSGTWLMKGNINRQYPVMLYSCQRSAAPLTTVKDHRILTLVWWIGYSPFTSEVESSTPTGGTCPNDFSDLIDPDIRTRYAFSWKKWYQSGGR